jgi:transcriptional regulator with XRE-family HTH domain
MEFNEKLQALRKQKNMTQEELAQALYVSRTAISKWESGRGFPSIDSLKAIARFFGVSVDDLLSGEEILTIAEADQKHKHRLLRDLYLAMLDLCAVLFLLLPFYGQKSQEGIANVSLWQLTTSSPYLKTIYFIAIFSMITFGILMLVLQNYGSRFWQKANAYLSIGLSTVCVMLFIISSQPYAAELAFLFLFIKVLILLRKP